MVCIYGWIEDSEGSNRTAAPSYSTCEAVSHSQLLTIVVTVRIETVHNSLQKGKLPVPNLSQIITFHAHPKTFNYKPF
jgi:hypothetical protein